MKPKSIKKNYIYNLIYQILVVIIPLITAPYLARVLGVEGVGIYSYTLSNVSYFILAANIGIASFGQREIAMHRDDRKKYTKIFWNLYGYQLLIGFISIACYVTYALLFSKYSLFQGVLTINLLAAVIDCTWLFQGLEEYKSISIRNILTKLFFTLAIFLFVHTPDDLIIYIVLNGASCMLSATIMWISYRKVADKRPKLREIQVFKYWKDTILYFLPQIAVQIYTVLDKTMLGLITGSQVENGYYEQSYRITSIVMTLITSLNIVVAPRMAYLYKKGSVVEIKDRLAKSLHFVFALSVPMTLGLIAVGPAFSQWFYGPGYEKVQTLMPICAPIIFIITMSNCLGIQCLLPCGKRVQNAIALWVGAGLNLVANLILIPQFASVGAAIGTIIAETAITIMFIIFSRKYLSFGKILKGFKNYLIAGIIMFVVLLVLRHYMPAPTVANTLIQTGVGVVVYSIVLLCTRDAFIFENLSLIGNKLGLVKKKG